MNNEHRVMDQAFKAVAVLLLLSSLAFNALKVAPVHANELVFGIGLCILSLVSLPPARRGGKNEGGA